METSFTACGRFGNLGATSRKREFEPEKHDPWLKAFLNGAACVVIWGALWWWLIYAYQFPRKSAGLDVSVASSAAASALPRSVPDRRIHHELPLQVPGTATCRSGTVELNGPCVLGEEIEVRAPPGRRER
jgi:hypothetical protein